MLGLSHRVECHLECVGQAALDKRPGLLGASLDADFAWRSQLLHVAVNELDLNDLAVLCLVHLGLLLLGVGLGRDA